MKTKLMLLMLFICGVTTGMLASYNSSSLRTDKEDQIELHGRFSPGTLRSDETIFDVMMSSSQITVTYMKNLSNITIEITDVTGAPEVVYRTTVNPVYGQQLPINISGLAEGSYMITFKDTQSGYMYGYFQVTE